MKLVAGLGNPGKEYENTRHNTGRIVVGLVEKKLEDQKIKFITPDNFMNNSGKAVAPLVKTKKDLENLVVVYDDIDLPLGKIKIFFIIRVVFSPATPKGVAKKPKGEKAVINFILGEFKKSELETIKKLSKKVSEAIETIFAEGKDKAMSLYN